MVTPYDLIHRLKSQNYILNIQYHVKVLLKRFHLNGNIIGFNPQNSKLQLHIQKWYHVKELLKVIQMFRNRWQQYFQVVYIIFCLYEHRKSKSPPGYKAPPQSNSQERTRVCTQSAEMILFWRSVDLISLYPPSSHPLVVVINKVCTFNRKCP